MNDSVILLVIANFIKVKMKRVLMLATIMAFVMIPAASFAKAVISDKDLDNVTAEAGVTITLSNLSISSLSFGTLSYSDNDGVDGTGFIDHTNYTNAGSFGAKNVTIVKGGSNVIDLIGNIDIDVGTSGAQSRVQIKLPSITIGGSAGMNVTGALVLAQDKTLSTVAGTLATIDVRGFKTYLGGTVQVFAH